MNNFSHTCPLGDCWNLLAQVRWWELIVIIIFQLSKLWKVTFFILCDVIFLVRLQGKFEIDKTLRSGNPDSTKLRSQKSELTTYHTCILCAQQVHVCSRWTGWCVVFEHRGAVWPSWEPLGKNTIHVHKASWGGRGCPWRLSLCHRRIGWLLPTQHCREVWSHCQLLEPCCANGNSEKASRCCSLSG